MALKPLATMLVACGPESGLGHLRRSQVLAQALFDRGFDIQWRVDGVPALAGNNATAFDPNAVITSDILVVDGYHFDFLGLRARFGGRICVIDDLCDQPVPADIVVNHNLYAPGLRYPESSKCLLGPSYCLIDPRFAEISGNGLSENDDILVTLGGAKRFAHLAVELAAEISRRTGRTVGIAAPSTELDIPIPSAVRLERDRPMADLFSSYARLVTGLGVSHLEALASGKPVFGVMLVYNQLEAFKAAEKLGLPVSQLANVGQLADRIITSLSKPFHQDQLVDGQGAARVAEQLALPE